MSNYRYRTLDSLIETYIDEHKRINREDRETTQRLIKAELQERMRRLIRLLDDVKSLEYDLKNRTMEEEIASIKRYVLNIE